MDTLAKPIFLVGPMGAGKTTIGKRLASALHGNFLDHDDYIIEQAKMTIPQIFDTYGEPYFRDLEHRCLQSLLDPNFQAQDMLKPVPAPNVIAGGGGIAQRADNRALIKEHSLCLYLHLPVGKQYERVKGDTNRPMIQVEDIYARLQALFAVRDIQFREIATCIIDTDDTIDNIVTKTLSALDPYLKR